MEKLVSESKLIYFEGNFSEEDVIVDMKIGNIYEVETYAGETGDTVCEFTSELESITIDDDWINKEDYPDGYITELVFKNGVTICEPQYDHHAVSICESDDIITFVKNEDLHILLESSNFGRNIEEWEKYVEALEKEAMDSMSTPEDIVPTYDLENEILEDWKKDRLSLLRDWEMGRLVFIKQIKFFQEEIQSLKEEITKINE